MDTTITLNLTHLLAFCVGFTTLCVAGSWLIKILSPIKKPVEDMKRELDKHDKAIKEHGEHLDTLDEIAKENTEALKLLFEVNLALLSTVDSDRATKMQDKINKFLINK